MVKKDAFLSVTRRSGGGSWDCPGGQRVKEVVRRVWCWSAAQPSVARRLSHLIGGNLRGRFKEEKWLNDTVYLGSERSGCRRFVTLRFPKKQTLRPRKMKAIFY
jgi:hypothetical protein